MKILYTWPDYYENLKKESDTGEVLYIWELKGENDDEIINFLCTCTAEKF